MCSQHLLRNSFFAFQFVALKDYLNYLSYLIKTIARGEGCPGEAQEGQPPLALSVKGFVYIFGSIRGHPLIS